MTRLNSKSPNHKYIVSAWSYGTFDDTLSTADFALDLTNYLANLKLKKTDGLSFITHSQGAVIFFLWLEKTLKGQNPIVNQIDSLINLAPAMWGAKIAEFGVTIKKIWEFAGIPQSLPFGKKQLKELGYSSDTVSELRRIFTNERIQRFAKKQLRVLTLAGKAQVMNIFAPFTAGNKEFEDDSAVPISSTRCGLYYTQAKTPFNHIPLSEQKLIEFGDYKVVDALHLSPTPRKIPGISQITNECIFNENPNHPSYKLIEDHILGKSATLAQDDLAKYSSFLIAINIHSTNEVEIDFLDINGDQLARNDITISNFLEPYSKGEVSLGNNHRLYYTGTILRSLASSGPKERQILVQISSDTSKNKFIEITVKATYSTFIDIDLSPKRP